MKLGLGGRLGSSVKESILVFRLSLMTIYQNRKFLGLSEENPK